MTAAEDDMFKTAKCFTNRTWKISTGIDVLGKIAEALNCEIDFIEK